MKHFSFKSLFVEIELRAQCSQHFTAPSAPLTPRNSARSAVRSCSDVVPRKSWREVPLSPWWIDELALGGGEPCRSLRFYSRSSAYRMWQIEGKRAAWRRWAMQTRTTLKAYVIELHFSSSRSSGSYRSSDLGSGGGGFDHQIESEAGAGTTRSFTLVQLCSQLLLRSCETNEAQSQWPAAQRSKCLAKSGLCLTSESCFRGKRAAHDCV